MAIYALRPLSTGEILDGALTLLRRHLRLVLWIALAFEGVPTVMDVYLDLAGGGGDHPGLALLDRILSATGAMLVTGATVRVVSEAYLGRTPRLRCAGLRGRQAGGHLRRELHKRHPHGPGAPGARRPRDCRRLRLLRRRRGGGARVSRLGRGSVAPFLGSHQGIQREGAGAVAGVGVPDARGFPRGRPARWRS